MSGVTFEPRVVGAGNREVCFQEPRNLKRAIVLESHPKRQSFHSTVEKESRMWIE